MREQRKREQHKIGAMLDRQASAPRTICRLIDLDRRRGDTWWKFSYSHRDPVLVGRQALRSLPAQIQSTFAPHCTRSGARDASETRLRNKEQFFIEQATSYDILYNNELIRSNDLLAGKRAW
jgi:hypothetical protein